jgi:hypothetical protein
MNMAAANHLARRAARPLYGHVLRRVPNSKPLTQLASLIFLSTNFGLGFASLPTARPTLADYDAMAMIRKGQVHNIGGHDMQAQAAFVADLFQVVA